MVLASRGLRRAACGLGGAVRQGARPTGRGDVKQQAEAKQADVEHGEATSYSSEGETPEETTDGGSLASDEALQALREKLTGGSN